MCGIFGMVRSAHDPDPAWASSVFVALGHLAEERGRDAAGFVLVGDGSGGAGGGQSDGSDRAALPGRDDDGGPRDLIHRRDVRLGRCRVVKDTRRWGSVWQPEFLQALDGAQAALGHTRHASQGTPGTLANAAPLAVGEGLIGVHNGDVDAKALRSGLPIARDARDNLYWASSPAWFRRLDEQTGGRLGFEVERVREGSVLAIATGATPMIRARRSFQPVARPGDGWRFPSIWNGLDPADVEAFQAEARHRTVRRRAAGARAELAEAAPAG